MPENLTNLVFGHCFNQKIGPNILPDNLITLTFGWFNQKIEPIMLPSSLKNIKFDWIALIKNNLSEQCIEMVNNIPNYYYVEILLRENIFDTNGPKWPIHVLKYKEYEWSSKIYEIQDKYIHSIYGDITVLINTKSYQPYSSAKSALK